MEFNFINVRPGENRMTTTLHRHKSGELLTKKKLKFR